MQHMNLPRQFDSLMFSKFLATLIAAAIISPAAMGSDIANASKPTSKLTSKPATILLGPASSFVGRTLNPNELIGTVDTTEDLKNTAKTGARSTDKTGARSTAEQNRLRIILNDSNRSALILEFAKSADRDLLAKNIADGFILSLNISEFKPSSSNASSTNPARQIQVIKDFKKIGLTTIQNTQADLKNVNLRLLGFSVSSGSASNSKIDQNTAVANQSRGVGGRLVSATEKIPNNYDSLLPAEPAAPDSMPPASPKKAPVTN